VSISGDLRDDFKRSSSNLEDKLSDLQKQDRENVQRLAAMEVKVEQQERKIAELFAENERLRRVTASQVPLSTPPTPHILELTTSHTCITCPCVDNRASLLYSFSILGDRTP
jgi:DNA repair exonuclease SbcCD ATPase subunit